MKPIKLDISAIGPYKDLVSIDFTSFYDDGIFLISGDTGSGKTTIFDAICFALFGVFSGSNRAKSSFRSDFASNDIKSYVRLEFKHKGIIYKIERSPSYMRKKKRGEGYIQVSGEASIVYLNYVITGDANVTNKCVEILGVSANQFKQISMIAQGEFMKLLLSKPSEKASIFRKIFATDIYKNISDRLKEKYLEVKREYEDIDLSLDNLRSSFILNKEVDNNITTTQLLELVNNEICQDSKEEDKLEVNKTKLVNKIQKIISDIDNANIINNNFLKYETVKKCIDDKLKMKKDIDIKRNLVNKNKDIYEFIVPVYNCIKEMDVNISLKKLELDKNRKLLDSVSLEYNLVLNKYNNLDKDNNKLSNLRVMLNEFENKLPLFLEIDNLKKELDDKNNIYNLLKVREYEQLMDKFRNNKIISDNFSGALIKFKSVKKKYEELNGKYDLMYNQFINCQAGIIASCLKDGCPCPVCGSCDHPSIAVNVLENVTKEDLDVLKDKLDKCQDELEIVTNKVSSLRKELELSNKEVLDIDIDDVKREYKLCKDSIVNNVDIGEYNLDDVLKDLSYIKASIDNKSALIADGISEDFVKSEIKRINLNIGKINNYILDIRKQYEEVKNEKIRLDSVIKVLNKEIIVLENERDKKNIDYIETYKKYGFEREEEYLNVMLEKDILLNYSKDVDNYDNELMELKSSLKTLEDLIKDKVRIDTSKLQVEKDEKNGELSKIDMSLKNIHGKISNNKLVYDKVKNVSNKIAKIESLLSKYEDLSNTANGCIKGKNKLEFEQYVQAYYFDNVLVSANKRFSYMTDDRYLLVRKIEATKISDKLGLELEVVDNYTGKKREVTSLSGGESFKASLALALGISDVIQCYSGGIVLETMFIDEGFGSLDSESLEQALNAILMLSVNDSLIGIISHVSELKDRVDKKIMVNKSNSGSTVRVVV